VHERRDSVSLRDMREESQRLQELMMTVNTEEEDEDETMPEPFITVVLFIVVSRFYAPLPPLGDI